MINPITNLILFLSFSISVLLSHKPVLLALHCMCFLSLLFFKKKYWRIWFKQTKPFWKIFPVAGVIFFLTSLLFSNQTLYSIIYDVIMATIRLILMVSIMSLYFVKNKGIDIVRSLRSIWYKIGLEWKWVEGLLLFISIVLRFFPNYQDEWKKLERSQKSLYRGKENTFIEKTKMIAHFIPDYIILNLEKSEALAHVIKMRGYGASYPRSVYPLVPFTFIDFILIIIVSFIFYFLHVYKTL